MNPCFNCGSSVVYCDADGEYGREINCNNCGFSIQGVNFRPRDRKREIPMHSLIAIWDWMWENRPISKEELENIPVPRGSGKHKFA